jgi:hypothetical protein
MGYYTEYLERNLDFTGLVLERKKQLSRISSLRDNRDILVIASDLLKNAPVAIDYSDLLAVQDQLRNLSHNEIDIILETPGGLAEVVEDIVRLVRNKYEKVGIIVPGYAKSAGTIFAMAGDEILMGPTSALGPIDAQVVNNGKRFSADAFLQGFGKIKEEVESTGKLNAAYIPMLQAISPGEIQHCENAQQFSQKLVSEWLPKYKFKYWFKHSTTGEAVTEEEKIMRAKEIAKNLCDHSEWLTHGKSITIADCNAMKLLINDFSKQDDLNDAIMRYYTLMRITFENTSMYKMFETLNSQLYRFTAPPVPAPQPGKVADVGIVDITCNKCNNNLKIQVNLGKRSPLQEGALPFPVKDNILKCPKCGTIHNLTQLRLQIEAQSKKAVV